MDKTIDTSRTVAVAGSIFGTVWKLIWSIVGLIVAGGSTAWLMQLARESDEYPIVFYVLAAFGTLFALVSLGRIIECGTFLRISTMS
jgi:peptidase E